MRPKRHGPELCSFSTAGIDDPFGSLNRTVPPAGVPISGEFGCVATSAYPGLNCPLYPLPLNFVYNDLEMATPTVQHINVSLQRQLTNDFDGRRGVHGAVRHQAGGTPPLQSCPVHQLSTDRRGSCGSATPTIALSYEPGIIAPTSRVLETRYRVWYNGVEMKATKRFSRGFMFSGFYTLSKAIDTLLNQGAGLTAGVANPFDLTSMKGRSEFDRRHVLGLSWMWEQTREFGNPVVDAVLRGWGVSGVHNVSSGNPINFTMGTDVALDGTGGAGRQLRTTG